jgi:hypothetical protein
MAWDKGIKKRVMWMVSGLVIEPALPARQVIGLLVIGLLVIGYCYWLLSYWNLEFGIWDLVPNSLGMEFGNWNLEFGICYFGTIFVIS